MKINIKALITICLAAIIIVIGCKKQDYSFGEILTPKNVVITTNIEGADGANPNGAGTGKVSIKVTATDAITYKIDYGDGESDMVSSGEIVHKYGNPGTSDYTITVSAVGTGGVTSIINKTITVFVLFSIPEQMMQDLTNGTSKTWVIANDVVGHVGVGPADTYQSDYYSADPNQRAACLYDDDITLTKDANNTITMTVDNKGQSFFIGGAVAFYGKAGGEDCYDFDVAAPRKLVFMDATSGSTSANSTRIQFAVPGNGLIAFGTGGKNYEIIELTDSSITLRNIGIDGLAWYQKFKVKP